MTEAEIYKQLLAGYQPALDNTQALIGAQDAFAQTQLGALNQQRVNDYRTINNQNNANGTLFGGRPILQQTGYLAEQYLPTQAKVLLSADQNKQKLRDQMFKLQNGLLTQAQQIARAGATPTYTYN